MAHFSPHQKKLIENYYNNRDSIMLNKLGDIVTELYLADSNAKRDRLWKRAEKAMEALDIPEAHRRRVLKIRRADDLARNLREWIDRPS